MKIQVKAGVLLKKLQRALTVIPSKPTIPALGFAKVDVINATSATISGSDLGMSIVTSVDIELKSNEVGSFLLPAKSVAAQLALVPSDANVTIDVQGTTLFISAGKILNKAKFATPTVSVFPAVETAPKATNNFNAAALKKVVGRVECAAPTKQGARATASVLIESSDTNLRAVASDGGRIAVADYNGAGAGIISFQIPKNFLPLLKDITGDVIGFSQSETNYFFQSNGEQLLIRIPTTKFPAYAPIFKGLDEKFKTNLSLAVPSLQSAVAIASVTSEEKTSAIYLSTTADEVSVSSTNVEGETESVLETAVTGDAQSKVKLNKNFIQDFLGQSEGQAQVQFINGQSLVKFSNGPDYQYLLMPLTEKSEEKEEKKSEKKSAK
jgi:DNA polymerase III sliding clamp (beta) subunit (PCNA family)